MEAGSFSYNGESSAIPYGRFSFWSVVGKFDITQEANVVLKRMSEGAGFEFLASIVKHGARCLYAFEFPWGSANFPFRTVAGVTPIATRGVIPSRLD